MNAIEPDNLSPQLKLGFPRDEPMKDTLMKEEEPLQVVEQAISKSLVTINLSNHQLASLVPFPVFLATLPPVA